MKIILLGLLAITLSSCSSVHVTKPTIPKYAPKNYRPTGVIKYLNQGADSVIQSRKEDAFKKMHDACGGNYKIISEGPKMEGGMIVAVSSGMAAYGGSQYWYISYECLQK